MFLGMLALGIGSSENFDPDPCVFFNFNLSQSFSGLFHCDASIRFSMRLHSHDSSRDSPGGKFGPMRAMFQVDGGTRDQGAADLTNLGGCGRRGGTQGGLCSAFFAGVAFGDRRIVVDDCGGIGQGAMVFAD